MDSHDLVIIQNCFSCTVHAESEPQHQLPITACDFAFLRVSQTFSSPSWLFPSPSVPKVDDVAHCIMFNARATSLLPYQQIYHTIDSVGDLNLLMWVDHMSVSFGKVRAINATQVAISVSALSGASGGPCFSEDSAGFMALYTGSLQSGEKYTSEIDNHASRVTNPHFIECYIKLVVSEIIDLSLPEPLKQYLRDNASFCTDEELRKKIVALH
eukprot:TRINITY_DN448_c0_g1_i2.p1 TRINITY_DN448_c0_g1~~TRINITY_DN448_c0_g1_i2.p1  ORF type:complete len:213 (-),score=31.09 TRINITY_DN448_c0_g1_i2:59-697(-)